MTASTTRSHKPAPKASAPHARHAVGDLFSAKVMTILKDATVPDAVPHALLVKFGNSIGYHPARNLSCATADRKDFMTKVRVGDDLTVMISLVEETQQKPRYQVSELKAAMLIAARTRIGELVSTDVINTEDGKVYVRFDKNLHGMIRTSELGSPDQKVRFSKLRPNAKVSAVIMNVVVDPLNLNVFRYELSELEAELKAAAEKVGERVETKIVALLDHGLTLVLPNGVQAYLDFDDFNGMPVAHLEFGGPLEVVIKGVRGNSLSVVWQAK